MRAEDRPSAEIFDGNLTSANAQFDFQKQDAKVPQRNYPEADPKLTFTAERSDDEVIGDSSESWMIYCVRRNVPPPISKRRYGKMSCSIGARIADGQRDKAHVDLRRVLIREREEFSVYKANSAVNSIRAVDPAQVKKGFDGKGSDYKNYAGQNRIRLR